MTMGAFTENRKAVDSIEVKIGKLLTSATLCLLISIQLQFRGR